MNTPEKIAILEQLIANTDERDWLEFKENNPDPPMIGEDISGLANAALDAGKPRAYLIYGVKDKAPHEVVGTTFNPETKKATGNQALPIWLMRMITPNCFVYHVFEYKGKNVVLFEITPSHDRPILFNNEAYIRLGTSTTKLRNLPVIERRLWTIKHDWSEDICERASIGDLDKSAIQKAREEFSKKNPAQESEVKEWDDITFLNKARITIQGQITNTAIVLLGKPESTTLLTSSLAQITWFLKDAKNQDIDYLHIDPPFIFAGDKLLGRIRNSIIRTLPDGTLFPIEVSQYDPWVIREAIHNCIAHQDYRLAARIHVVETPTSLLFTNRGAFLPGSVESVIQMDAPPDMYRNPFLARAMVNLNMIDTQGGGIKKMFSQQRKRFFPMPDYDLTQSERVEVRIEGRIMDERYAKVLLSRGGLDLNTVILLDRVQKKITVTKDEAKFLRNEGLVDGRYPHLVICSSLADNAEAKATRIKDKGFNNRYYKDLIIQFIGEYKSASRQEIDAALMNKLPNILSGRQKLMKIHNLLYELSARDRRISNIGNRRWPKWVLLE
jgi:ATP-dependent DNA helicase RecG